MTEQPNFMATSCHARSEALMLSLCLSHVLPSTTSVANKRVPARNRQWRQLHSFVMRQVTSLLIKNSGVSMTMRPSITFSLQPCRSHADWTQSNATKARLCYAVYVLRLSYDKPVSTWVVSWPLRTRITLNHASRFVRTAQQTHCVSVIQLINLLATDFFFSNFSTSCI